MNYLTLVFPCENSHSTASYEEISQKDPRMTKEITKDLTKDLTKANIDHVYGQKHQDDYHGQLWIKGSGLIRW